MKNILTSILVLGCVSLSFAQVDRTKMPEPGPAPKVELGETQEFELPNGMKVFVVENHKLPRVAYSLVLDIDPLKEGDKAGMSDLAGDLMSRGTKNRSKDEINFEVDFIGASFNTSSSSVFGASLKKHQEKLLELMSDVVKNAEFSQDEMDKLKTQYVSGIQTEKDDPDAIARNVRRVLMYGKDHPYGEIMTEASVENITLDDVKNYYSTFFRPNVAYMAIVGDITMEEVKPLMEKYFGDWAKGDVPNFTYEMPKAPKATQIAFVNKPGAVQSVISVFNPIDLKPGQPNVIKSTIANGILGGGFVSKLNLNLREAHAYTYGARSSISSDELVGNFNASAKVRNEVTDSALTEMMKELMNMRSGKITADELTAIKNYRTGTFSISLENAQTKARFAINTEKYGLPSDYYANYLKNIDAVTLDDVKAMANQYITPQNGYVLVVGNKEEVAEKVKAFSPTGQIQFYDAYGNVASDKKMKAAPSDMTGQAVINRFIESIGGKANIAKIKTLKKVASLSIPGAPPLQLEMSYSLPNNFMSEMKSGDMVFQKQVYNGSAGQVSGMQGNKKMEAEELEAMKVEAAMFPEMMYEAQGLKVELKGIDEVMDQEAYVVDVTMANGDVKTEYYSKDSGYLIKSTQVKEIQGQTLTEENTYEDYKKVGKIYFSHKMTKVLGQSISMTINSIDVNKKMDASMFKVD